MDKKPYFVGSHPQTANTVWAPWFRKSLEVYLLYELAMVSIPVSACEIGSSNQ